MARFAPIALMLAVMLSCLAFATPDAKADGKVFLSIVTDTGSGSTMPRQRAIIAYKDGEQRLAIDTAFTGAGEEFAWLVPLPSEPEILPATKGMFDAAAMVTAPRVSGRGASLDAMVPVIVILPVTLLAIWFRARRLVPLALILLNLVLLFLWIPLLGGSTGGAAVSLDVLQQETVGLYDTAVLGGTNSDAVTNWLSVNGFAVPEGAESVMQDYLDRGWVFAAAKLRGDAKDGNERRAHPLQFRFAVEQPIYPMALTAVGNDAIALELFVFADGTASAKGLEALTSFRVQSDPREEDDRSGRGLWRSHPVPVSHPGLMAVAGDLSTVTRLTGFLSGRDQQQDLILSIQEATEIDTILYTPEARLARALGLASTAWIVCGIVWLVLASVSGESAGQPLLPRKSSRLLWTVLVLAPGVCAGGVVYLSSPVYRGEFSNRPRMMNDERALEVISHVVQQSFEDEPAESLDDVLSTVEAAMAEDDRIFPTGDSPLHYRIEFNDDETEARFIWHDLIGGEHRVVIPLAGDAGDEPTP
ncbi:MAG: DUF2330 domain-containing protein [Phycisphaerales bacterium JB050]